MDGSEIFNALYDEDNEYWSKFEDDVRRKLTRRIEELLDF